LRSFILKSRGVSGVVVAGSPERNYWPFLPFGRCEGILRDKDDANMNFTRRPVSRQKFVSFKTWILYAVRR
jgi:hypothetical protein